MVDIDDLMPAIQWTRHISWKHRDTMWRRTSCNKSSILLARNGKALSSKHTKHIAIRYFIITDHILKGCVSLEWCPTTEIIADFMSKPLQGSLFQKFRVLLWVLILWSLAPRSIKSGNKVNAKSSKDVSKPKSSGKIGSTHGKSLARY